MVGVQEVIHAGISVKLKVDERITRQELKHRDTGKSWMTTSSARRMPQYTTGQETLLSRLLAYPRETKPQYPTGQETLLQYLLAYPRETKDIAPLRVTTKPRRQHFFFF